jgi:hypothetical protein
VECYADALLEASEQRRCYISPIVIDTIKPVTIRNGVLRIDCMAIGPNMEEWTTGTLLIPRNQVDHVLRSLTQAVQELDKGAPA